MFLEQNRQRVATSASKYSTHTNLPMTSTNISTVMHAKYGGQAPEGPLLPTFSSSICTKMSKCSTTATMVVSVESNPTDLHTTKVKSTAERKHQFKALGRTKGVHIIGCAVGVWWWRCRDGERGRGRQARVVNKAVDT